MNTQRFRRIMSMSVIALAVLAGLPWHAKAVPVFLGPSHYLSFADSPFNIPGFTYFHLENLEDGLFNTPGATPSAGWIVGTPNHPFSDSVDGDDGAIDGSGNGGRSFYSTFTQTSLMITFNAMALSGNLPTHAGIVWTDVGVVTSGMAGRGNVTFSARDSMGNSLGSIGPILLGDGVGTGNTDEDRFFGVTHEGGISSITIAMNNSLDWEVDHPQYGFAAVPEPSTMILFGFGTLALLGYRWRRG